MSFHDMAFFQRCGGVKREAPMSDSRSDSEEAAEVSSDEPMHKKVKQQSEDPSTIPAAEKKVTGTDCAAAQAVFQTAELVENIVRYLPPKNIFGVLRVSKAFANTLKSATIQERIWLRPNKATKPPTRFWKFDRASPAIYPSTPSPFLEDVGGLPYRGAWMAVYLGSEDPAALDRDESVLDTHFCDPISVNVRVSVTFKIGEYKVLRRSQPLTARTWREAIDATESGYRVQRWDGRFIKRPQGAGTMRKAIAFLEKESGSRAVITHLQCSLESVVFPINKKWERNGKAPWKGFVEVIEL